MEKIMKQLFDFQRFEGNERLGKLISETENRSRELSENDLNMVSAAGIPNQQAFFTNRD